MVEFLLGKRELISVGKETTYGISVSPTYLFGRNAKFDPNKNAQKWEEILGSGTDNINVKREIGNQDIGGTLTFTPQDWSMFYFILGSVNTTGSSPYTHTFTNSNTIPSFTLERAIQATTDRVRTYKGCQVDSATINFATGGGAGGGYIDLSLEILAQDVSPGTTTTSLSAPTTQGFQFRHAKLTLNSTEIVELISGSLNINNNLSDGRYANYTLNEKKGESAPQIRKITGNFVINIKDDTYFDFWKDRQIIPGTNKLMFQRGENDYVEFTFTNIVVPSAPDPTNLEGINTVTLNFEVEEVSVIAKDNISAYFGL